MTLWGLLEASGFVASAATLIGFCSAMGWPIELAAHFRIQYLLGLTFLAVVFAIGRRRFAAGAFLAFAAMNGAVTLPGAFEHATAQASHARPLRLMWLNVEMENQDYASVLDAVRRFSPDAVMFAEVDEDWMRQLASLSAEYPTVAAEPRADNFGIALFSRLPLTEARVIHVGMARLPSIEARLPFGGTTLSLVGTHPTPPVSRASTTLRDDQLDGLAHLVATLPSPYVLLGDLNTSPWSRTFGRLLEDGKLLDGRRGEGLIRATWPTTLWPMLVPIDHCLVSRDVRVVASHVGPFIGSDHYPLIVDLAPDGGASGEGATAH